MARTDRVELVGEPLPASGKEIAGKITETDGGWSKVEWDGGSGRSGSEWVNNDFLTPETR